MNLETVFRRGAAAQMATSAARFKDVRASMELVFGFLAQQLGDAIDHILKLDSLQVFGVLAALEACGDAAEGAGNVFIARVVGRQRQRCLVSVEKTTAEQVKAIEQTRITVKKRKGIAAFISIFPSWAERIEVQVAEAGGLPVRALVDKTYSTIVRTMFEVLQHMAKMDEPTTGEDKEQLNAHVILVFNAHHFATSVQNLRIAALAPAVKQASDIYDENLSLYVRLVLRRPLGRHYDFFQGLEQLLRTTPPSEVGLHASFTKSACKRVGSSMGVKDLRKAIEALAKRVEKHFGEGMPSGEAAEVCSNVWRACGDEVAKCAVTWKGLIDKCYPESSASLEFNEKDAREGFQRSKPTVS